MASRSVEIFLIANADKWIKGIDKATAKADELGRAIQKQKNIADLSFKAGAALFVGAAGMIASTVGPAIKLEDAVGRIAAQTGLTGAAYDAFTKKLSADTKRLSVEIGASLDSVISAYDMAVREGIDPASASFDKFVKQALQLSTVTGTDLPTAIATVDNVLDRFGTTLSKTPDAMDMLYRASRAGETGFQEFTNTLALSAQAAGALELPLDQVAALMALLGQRGMTGSRAGMAMGQALARLATASKDSADKLHALNVNILDPATGKVRDLANVFSDLRKAILSLPEAKRDTVLMELLGPAGFRVLGGLIKDVNTDFRGMFDTISKGKGVNEAFAESAKSASHKLDVMKASITAARTEIGTAFLPILAQAAEGLTGVLATLTPFIRANADLIAPLTGAALALGIFGMAAGKAAWALTLIKTTWPAFAAALGPIAIAVAALTAGIILFTKAAETNQSKIDKVTQSLSDKEAKVSSLKTKIDELAPTEQAWIDRGFAMSPAMAAATDELKKLNDEIAREKGLLEKLQGGPVPAFQFERDAEMILLGEKRLKIEKDIAQWRSGNLLPEAVDLRLIKMKDELSQVGARMDLLANVSRAAAKALDALSGSPDLGGGAGGGDALSYLERYNKWLTELIANEKKAKEEAYWASAPTAAGPQTPMGPAEPTVGLRFADELVEQTPIIQSEYAKWAASAGDTALSIVLAFTDMYEQLDSLAQNFGGQFADQFVEMVDSGKNVFKSFVSAFADMLQDMLKMLLKTLIQQIIAVRIEKVFEAMAQGFANLGWGGIALIVGAATAAIGALNALKGKMGKGYASGGIIPETGLILAHAGERIINPARNTASDLVNMLAGTRLAAALTPVPVAAGAGATSTAAAPFYFHMPIYGNVSNELDMEKVMRKAADIFRSRSGG